MSPITLIIVRECAATVQQVKQYRHRHRSDFRGFRRIITTANDLFGSTKRCYRENCLNLYVKLDTNTDKIKRMEQTLTGLLYHFNYFME